MADPRPRRKHKHHPGVGQGADRAALVGLEVRQEPGPSGHGLGILGYLDLAVGDKQVRPLVNLVLLELLPRGQSNGDRPRLLVGAQHLRMMWPHVEAADIPVLHAAFFLPPQTSFDQVGCESAQSSYIPVVGPGSAPDRLRVTPAVELDGLSTRGSRELM